MFYGLAALAAFLAIPILPFVALRKRRRHAAVSWWFAALCFFTLLIISLFISEKIRTHAFERLAERSESLINSIRAFEIDNDRPPFSLDELIPEYLIEVPSTGIMAYPEYQYHRSEKTSALDGNPWILRISTPSGGINFDSFVYYPNQNYPETGYGGWLERIGDWAYVHE